MSPDDLSAYAPPEQPQPAPPNRHQRRALQKMAKAEARRARRAARDLKPDNMPPNLSHDTAESVLAREDACDDCGAPRAPGSSYCGAHDRDHLEKAARELQEKVPYQKDPGPGVERFYDLSDDSGAASVLEAALTDAVKSRPIAPVTTSAPAQAAPMTLAEKIRAARKP